MGNQKICTNGEVSGDVRNRRFVYYDVQANRPTKENQTKTETVEPNTDVLPVIVSPIEIDKKMIVKGDMELNDTNKVAFDGFFDAVYTPTFGTPEV